MAKPDKKKLKKSAGAKAAAKAASKVTAHPRLVAAIRSSDNAMEQAKSLLVTVAEIVQQEDLTRPEVVASIMEARSVEKSTAESQYSRMKRLLTDPETLTALKEGKITLKAAREGTTKKQAAPNEKKKKENAEKKFAKAVSSLVETSKEIGMDFTSVIKAVKAALKKGGVAKEEAED